MLLYVDRFLYSRAGSDEPGGTDGVGADLSAPPPLEVLYFSTSF